MIYFLRSATIASGKMVPAVSFARDIAEYIKKKTGKNVTLGMPIGGQSNRVGWFVEYDNLVELDKIPEHSAARLGVSGNSIQGRRELYRGIASRRYLANALAPRNFTRRSALRKAPRNVEPIGL